jgi:23S rRNA (cytosine1962-C5)-methyltransferase
LEILVTRLIAFEDEHLLVVRKPPGINTHSVGPYAGEGIYEWLRHREPRFAQLAIIQRLDKETSGVLVFSKTRRGNISLTKQFSCRRVGKEYVLWTDRRPAQDTWEAHSWIRKGRGRFESVPEGEEALEARTQFTVQGRHEAYWSLLAEPLTGRTHQIRIHAAEHGIPILGDVLYGGTAHSRLCLHARALRFRHPATNEPLEFIDEPTFDVSVTQALRASFVEDDTDACRVIHGAADGIPGWYVDRLGEVLLASFTGEPIGDHHPLPEWLQHLAGEGKVRSLRLRRLDRQLRESTPAEASPKLAWGEDIGPEFPVRENGLTFWLNLGEGCSTGLFLDQRDNRRRLRRNWVGAEFPLHETGLAGTRLLNVFAYTCGFSVAAASAGAMTTSLDLSRKYLDWGRRNFTANSLDPGTHDFIHGDAFEWMKRLLRKGRQFDTVLLDPPTFSQSREHGIFRAETDYTGLVAAAAPLVKSGGVLFASTNAMRLDAERFLEMIHEGLRRTSRRVVRELFVPQPPDFPTTREEPAHLKTVWIRVEAAG